MGGCSACSGVAISAETITLDFHENYSGAVADMQIHYSDEGKNEMLYEKNPGKAEGCEVWTTWKNKNVCEGEDCSGDDDETYTAADRRGKGLCAGDAIAVQGR